MKSFLTAAGLAALALTSVSANASVTQLGAVGDMTTSFVNDFETAKDVGPVTFNATSFLGSSASYSAGVTTSGVQGLSSGTFPDTITANLSGYYTAVGLSFGNDDTCCARSMTAVLSVFDGATFLGSVSLDGNMNDAVDQFLGLSSTVAFNRVTIDYGQVSLYTFIDDFRIGGGAVPEPASWAMMIGGFALAGAAMRRRNAAVRFA